MIIEIEFDERYKTWDLRGDKYSSFALSFALIYHILSQTISFFSLAIFVLVSSPLCLSFSVHLSHFFTFAVCLRLTHSIAPAKARERAVRGEHVHVNNGGGQLLPNEVCLMADLSLSVCVCVCVCVCGQGVLPFSSSIIQPPLLFNLL